MIIIENIRIYDTKLISNSIQRLNDNIIDVYNNEMRDSFYETYYYNRIYHRLIGLGNIRYIIIF